MSRTKGLRSSLLASPSSSMGRPRPKFSCSPSPPATTQRFTLPSCQATTSSTGPGSSKSSVISLKLEIRSSRSLRLNRSCSFSSSDSFKSLPSLPSSCSASDGKVEVDAKVGVLSAAEAFALSGLEADELSKAVRSCCALTRSLCEALLKSSLRSRLRRATRSSGQSS